MKNIEKKKISVRIKNVNVYFYKGAHMLLQKELIPMIEANLPNMAYAEKYIAKFFLKQQPLNNYSCEALCECLNVSKATLTRFSSKVIFAFPSSCTSADCTPSNSVKT